MVQIDHTMHKPVRIFLGVKRFINTAQIDSRRT